MRVSAIDAAMRACLPVDELLTLMATGLADAMELMLDDPGASADVCTLLVAYSPGTSNIFPLYYAKLWHDFVVVRVLQRFSKLASRPPVFRNWLGLGDESGVRRHAVLKALLMRVNRECIVDGVNVLYKNVLYNLCNKHLPGVTKRMMQLDGPAPAMDNAQGHPYYRLRRTYTVSADGLPYDGRPKRRVEVLEHLCLFVMASTVLDAFTKTQRHPWSVSVRVAFADALRSMVVDDSFDWGSHLPADYPSGPCTWRLLLPSRRQRVARDIELQTMSDTDMQQWAEM